MDRMFPNVKCPLLVIVSTHSRVRNQHLHLEIKYIDSKSQIPWEKI